MLASSEKTRPTRRTKKLEEEASQSIEAAAPVTPESSTPSAAIVAKSRRPKLANRTLETVVADAETSAVAETKPKVSRTRTKKVKDQAAEPAKQPTESIPPAESDSDLPIPTWRPRAAKAEEPTRATSNKRTTKAKKDRSGVSDGSTAIEITGHGAVEVPLNENRITAFTDEDISISFRPRAGAKSSAPQKPSETTSRTEDDVTFSFRPTGKAEVQKERNKEEPKAASQKTAGDKSNRESKGRKPAEEGTSAVIPPKKEAPAPPEKPVKPSIHIPETAPQVVLREGVPTLVRAGRVLPPIVFFGSSSNETRAQTVLDELKMAAEAGIHIHSHLIEFEVNLDAVDDNVAVAAYLLKKSVEIDPSSQVIFRVVFQAPRNWPNKYPNAKYNMNGGGIAEPSVCDEAFWGDAAECLRRFVRKLRLLDLRDSILGVHLERGEWFSASGWGYDDSLAAKLQFRDWARQRYSNDEVALRASWFDGDIKFENIQVPRYSPEGSDGDRFVRSSRKQRKYVDYHLFISDATVHRIGELAYAAKQASEGNFLVGVSYGYTFEWSHPSSGHLSLGKLLRSPEIDFIAGPPSYKAREPGGSAPFPGPVDSYALNGKLYISEEDFKTSLSGGHEPDDFNPVIKTPQALENIHWRGAGAALAHGSGVAWMDLWGNGWLKTPSIWERGRRVLEALIERMGQPLGDPEVVVFIDERALAYLVDPNAFHMLVQDVREAVLRAGVNAGFYLLSDLAHREQFPEAKLYMFLNAWDIRPELRAAIKSRLQCDQKVLFWLYSAGLFDAGRDSLERAREVTGIALKPQPFHSRSGTTILAKRHPLTAALTDRHLGGHAQLEPSYFAIPEDATVLGEYSQTGLPSFVIRDFAGDEPERSWTSVFLGEPEVTPALVRSLAQLAGAHVFDFQEDVVHVRPPFLTIHCKGTGQRAITLPNKWSAYDMLSETWIGLDQTMLRFTGIDGTTHPFLVGPKEEIQHLLDLDPTTVLTMTELPPKQENLLREDGFAFDVPIMKLGDWIESSDSGEVADEWFLRPQQILEDLSDPEAEKIGKRRGRKRTRNGGNSNDSNRGEFGTPSGEFDSEAGMSFSFRKRT